MKQLWSLQYLRAFAALSVLCYHVLESSNHKFHLGNMGVDIFFVLSGFLMYSLTARGNRKPLQFLSDRIARIAPIYWVATIGTFACACIDPSFLPPSSYADLRLLLNSLLFLPYFDPVGRLWPTVFVGWSLNYEMFFYVLFACAIALPRHIRLTVLSIVLSGLVLAGWIATTDSAMWLTYTGPLLLEFLAGAWIGRLYLERDGRPLPAMQAAAGYGAIVLSLLILGQTLLPRIEHGWIAAMLVIAGILLERAGRLPQIGILKSIGDASYSIYLFQQFAFGAVDRVIDLAAQATHLRLDDGPTRIPVEFGVAVALGFAAYYWMERPLTAHARALLAKVVPQPPRLAAMAAS